MLDDGCGRAGGMESAAVAGASQLAPVLARAAVQQLLGRPADLDMDRLSLQRAALGMKTCMAASSEAGVLDIRRMDTWEQLATLQAAGVGQVGYEARLEAEEAAAHALERRSR